MEKARNDWELKTLLPNDENHKIINEFLLNLKKENKEKRIKFSRKLLQSFFKDKEDTYSSLTSDDIQQWLSCRKVSLKEVTISSYLSALRIFYRYCVDKGYMEKSPVPYFGKKAGDIDKYWELKISLPNEENQKVINEFLVSLKSLESEKITISYFRKRLQSFFKERKVSYSSLTATDIKLWVTASQKKLKKTTISTYLSVLRVFYEFCVNKGYMNISPIPEKVIFKVKSEKYWELKTQLPNAENQKVVNEYLFSLHSLNRKEETISTCRKQLQFIFKESKVPYSSLTSDDILQWVTKRQEVMKESSLTNYLRSLRDFYRFCIDKGYIDTSPVPEKMKKRTSTDTYWKLKVSLINEENQKVVNEFLYSLKRGNRDKDTIIYYRKRLQFFFKERKDSFSSLTTDDIEKWSIKHQKNMKKTSISKYVSALRTFYNFCVERKYIDKSPVPYRGRLVGEEDKYWELRKDLPNKENQKIINEYLLSEKNRNMTKFTVIFYRKQLQLIFKDFEKSFKCLTSEELRLWVTKYQVGKKRRTIYLLVRCLYYFYDFCVDEGYIITSPMQNVLKGRRRVERHWEVQIDLPNKKNQDAINEYLLSLKVMNYSWKTIKGYRLSLQHFFGNRMELFADITSEIILDYLHIYAEGRKETTFSQYLNALKSFYDFYVDEGYLEKSPIKSRWFPRIPISVPKYLGKDEVVKVRQVSEKDLLRNRALLEFLLSSGCRIGEVHKLNWADVDLENRTAIVIGKGSKIRTVHFTERSSMLLERYLETRKDQNPALFVTINGRKPRRLSINRMQVVLGKMGERANLMGTLFPHRFRHTFATDLLEKGAELSFISDELGHNNLKTTKVYANLPKRKIISMYRKYMG